MKNLKPITEKEKNGMGIKLRAYALFFFFIFAKYSYTIMPRIIGRKVDKNMYNKTKKKSINWGNIFTISALVLVGVFCALCMVMLAL